MKKILSLTVWLGALATQTGKKGQALKQQLKAKLIEHKKYIDKNGQDLPEIRNWKWKTN
jgi:xylulose-5-phosphate/fructose-6-phosphate phosphoketolase